MLISRRAGELTLVTHPEHARVAGLLAREWGNAHFAPSRDPGPLLVAAVRHDDGWVELDGAPAVRADAGRPAHFLEVPLEQTVDPYRAGVDRIYDEDLRAGILASMHWAGLYSSRWGVQDGTPVGHPLAREVVASQETQTAPLVRELWAGAGLRSSFEAELWRDYELLQAFDFLSLVLCLLDLGTESEPGELPAPATLREIDQPPGGRAIPSVPASAGAHVALSLRVAAPGVVVVDPFPLRRSGVEVEIDARVMADGPHDDPVAVYQSAARLTRRAVLVPAPADG